MALLDKKTGRGSAAISTGAAGVKAGAASGGLYGAIAGGVLGAAGGALFGGSEQGYLNKEELEELKRRQEMGALGLTDEEEGAMRGEMAGQAGQQFAQQQAQQAGLTATQGLGSGASAKEASLRVGEEIKANQAIASTIRQADVQERLKEEARMSALTGEVSAQQQADQQSALAGIVSAGSTFGDVRKADQLSKLSIDELRALKNREDAVKGIGVDTKDQKYEEFISLFQQIYGA